MIRRIEELTAAPGPARLAAGQPDLLAGLWLQAFAQVRGGVALYDCGGGVFLTVHGTAGVLTGRPGFAQRRELKTFLPLAGVRTLYTRDRLLLGLPGTAAPLVWMHRTPVRTQALPQQNSYAAAAQLVCQGRPKEVMMDFYADLCARRNRGLMRVLRTGEDTAPTGCVALAGPLPLNESPAAPTILYFSDLMVEPAHRGHGLGARLLAGAEACALQLGADKLVLHCAPDMAPFYARHGWVAGGKIWMRKL